jgi:hypothetical protein
MPEPININELKRLLVEMFCEIIDNQDRVMSWSDKQEYKRAISRRIERAILDGDDS